MDDRNFHASMEELRWLQLRYFASVLCQYSKAIQEPINRGPIHKSWNFAQSQSLHQLIFSCPPCFHVDSFHLLSRSSNHISIANLWLDYHKILKDCNHHCTAPPTFTNHSTEYQLQIKTLSSPLKLSEDTLKGCFQFWKKAKSKFIIHCLSRRATATPGEINHI